MTNATPTAVEANDVQQDDVMPPRYNQKLADILAARGAGKAFQIVVKGKCKVCRRNSPAIPATQGQVMRWVTEKDTTGMLQYQIRSLKEGLHRECQPVHDAKMRARAEKRAAAAARKRPVVLEADKVERAIARRARQNA